MTKLIVAFHKFSNAPKKMDTNKAPVRRANDHSECQNGYQSTHKSVYWTAESDLLGTNVADGRQKVPPPHVYLIVCLLSRHIQFYILHSYQLRYNFPNTE